MSDPPTLDDKLKSLPPVPGVYLMKDARGKVLYVGKAVSLRSRVRSYFQTGADRSPWIARLLQNIRDFDFIVTNTEKEALILEGNLIQMHHPRFNIRFRDDKKFPYLKLTVGEEFPALVETRTPKSDSAIYFGPFSNAKPMRDSVKLIKRVFGVRSGAVASESRRSGCPWRDTSKPLDRPCLEYFIRCCSAPCVGYIDATKYREQCSEARRFLEGRQGEILEALRVRMNEASAHLQFEEAARCRDQIQAVERVVEKQKVVSLRNEDQDVIAIAVERGVAMVQMLIIRSGKLIGEEHFPLDGVEGREEIIILEAFVKQHYGPTVHIPQHILLPVAPADAHVLPEWLSDKRGGPAGFIVPRRGRRRRLVEMAQQNAQQSLRQLLDSEDAERRLSNESLVELETRLQLHRFPARIECYDISNFQGKHAVGSMVVMEEGRPAKRQYRRFRIQRAEETPDDYAMLRETLRRRLQRAVEGDEKFLPLPDLLVVDGGKGHLGCAVDVVRELGLDCLSLASLAKEHELVYRPGRSSPIALPQNSGALFLMQRLRDEAHRFAVQLHRKRRSTSQVHSVLDEVPGIGEQRRNNLLKKFGSVRRIKTASLDDIAAVKGMTRPVAAKLQEHLSRHV